ncbi:MAG: rRNA maturation RNase YbeY [Dehalococcoidia bacterium]|nr:rRNA maturation RNase YbeY [Dehalococcoidia bacterium]
MRRTKKEEIYVQIDTETGDEPEKAWFESLARDTLAAENVAPPYEVSVVISDEDTVHEMNRHYRNVDSPTDVISFYTQTPAETAFVLPEDGVQHLGDIVISFPQAVEQAQEQGHSVKKELTLLTIHGLLHLLEYDHEEPDDAVRMRGREAILLEQFKGYYCD